MPVLTFADAPPLVQLLIGCLTAGMMCAGGFVLATVPLAGVSYVLLVAAGAFFVLLQDGSPIYLGLTALLTVYAGVVIVNLNWNAFLFVSHFLAEAQVQKEVAAREQVQAQAAHTERMTALGELAGGIAHDFNNILQALAGNAALIEKHPENIQEVRRQAGAMLDAGERGGSISRRLLAFARRDVLTKEPVDAVGMLSGLHELLQRMLGSGITVRVEADPQLGALLADKPQLETVLLNLAANARDAMPNGGELTLLAASEAIDQDRENPRLKAGRYISISVADSGIGMDAATLTRATEPFFTTKPKGKGTGLGLSMAKGFAEQSGGAFAISSEPGRGTIARIWLPQADAAITGSPAQPVPCLADGSAVDRKRHVLVVDDDELVRQVLMLSLEGAGFAIAGAPDGSHALAYLDRGEKVDALVTDFAMPGMNGVDLIAAARNRTPSLPAVLLTGHVGDIALPAFDGASKNRFILIQKPVRAAELAERLARAIDEAGS